MPFLSVHTEAFVYQYERSQYKLKTEQLCEYYVLYYWRRVEDFSEGERERRSDMISTKRVLSGMPRISRSFSPGWLDFQV